MILRIKEYAPRYDGQWPGWYAGVRAEVGDWYMRLESVCSTPEDALRQTRYLRSMVLDKVVEHINGQ